MGCICVTTTRAVVELAVTRLPGSTRRRPTRPSMGEVMWQKPTCTWSYWTVPWSFLHRALVLQHELFLVFERLARDGILRPGILIALQVHLRFGQQILVALERALRLLELCLVGPRIDIDQRIALVHESGLRDSGRP